MNTISFKATFTNNVNIKILNEDGQFIDKQVAFVKRNPYSQLDYDSIVVTGKLWGDVKPNYVTLMLNHAKRIEDSQKRDVYFLTEQEENFRKIIPEKVLGMIEITKHKNYNNINFIQTCPENVYGNKKRKNSGIGYAMLTMADKLSEGKDIILNARRKAIEFYKKYGFVVTYDKCINPKMVLKRGKSVK